MESSLNLPKRIKYDSLVQAKFVGDDYPKGFSTGISMRNSETVKNLTFIDLKKEDSKSYIKVRVLLKDSKKHYFVHRAIISKMTPFVETYVTLINSNASPLKVEMLSSFSISNLSPFGKFNIPNNMLLTRFRTKWAMEGYPETTPIERFQLEPSWKPSGAGLLKYGQVGSMPVRGFFPTLFITDSKRNCTWGVKLDASSLWQIEAYRLDEDLSISGGIADRDYGKWLKTINSGEKFTTPHAYISVCEGDYQKCSYFLNHDLSENKLSKISNLSSFPIEYNDFCFDWGKPSSNNIRKQISIAKYLGVSYFVIDAGWYGEKNKNWEISLGDWKISTSLFPEGLEKIISEIRNAGMIPGIWFEFENVGRASSSFNEIEHLLKKDGVPLTVGDRRFWDMNDPWVINYINVKVIDFLKKYNIGYLKIDYNENYGSGFDSNKSFGEASRQQIIGTQKFIKKIHQKLPNLIIENCSSGGHRLENTFMKLTDISSFSDAHEIRNIPVIAGNLHSLMLPSQELIWAVVHPDDSIDKIDYSLNSSFMGRPCLSGDLSTLNDIQIKEIKNGLDFYKKSFYVIKNGYTTRIDYPNMSQRILEGVQTLIRYSADKSTCVVFFHGFKKPRKTIITIDDRFVLNSIFGAKDSIHYNKGILECNFSKEYQSVAIKFCIN